MLRLLRASTFFGLICAPVVAQMASIPEPAVPADPLELVTGDAQPVQDVNQRASAIEMLTSAYRHDMEVIASTNASFNSAALDYAAKWKSGLMSRDVEPGATPQSHEVFLTLQYVAPRGSQLP